VNTTPVGTRPDVEATPLPDGPFTGRLVYDLVYNPTTTRLLADAAAAGCDTIGGLEMLVAQAVRQFAWWTGQRPAPRLFREAAKTELARQVAEDGRGASGARDRA
jgi:shikimate 5-dehydrogenase